MIAFKRPELIAEYENLLVYPMKDVVEWIDDRWFGWTGQRFFVVTNIYYVGGSGVHAVGRGLDGSAREGGVGGLIHPHVSRLVMGKVNEAWDYGKPPYQVCLYHRSESSTEPEWHFHVQVRSETRLRDDGTASGGG